MKEIKKNGEKIAKNLVYKDQVWSYSLYDIGLFRLRQFLEKVKN